MRNSSSFPGSKRIATRAASFRFPRIAATLAFALIGAGSVRADLPKSVDLRVERIDSPLAVDRTAPRFSWRISDKDRGAAQTAYRILVASTLANLDADTGDLWDTGKSGSGCPTTLYAGLALSSDTRYFWKVKSWDNLDSEGPWSASSTFRTGLTSGDWNASWIWDASPGPNDYCYLRKTFNLSGTIDEGIAYVTAHDDYVLFVNGTEVGRGPAQTDPVNTGRYNTYDIQPFLVTGANVIAARGHYRGAFSGSGVGGMAAFRFQARIETTPGGTTAIVSDTSWRVLETTPFDETSPFRGPAFAKGTTVESFDARLIPVGWKLDGFDDSSWALATSFSPGYSVEPQLVPLERTLEILDPVSLIEVVPGVWLADFGTNRAGWPILTLAAASSGDQIDVWYSEEMSGSRIIRDRNGITDYRDRYIAKGVPGEVFEPDVRYNGFRYLEIEGLTAVPSPTDVRLRVVTTAPPRVGSFECSNALYNSIYEISVRTQENCTQGTLVDCPQRELTQYSFDAYIQALNLFTNYPDSNFLDKVVSDFSDGTLGPGVFRAKAPTSTNCLIPEWAMIWIEAIWAQYMYADDVEALGEHYDQVKAMLDALDPFRDPGTNLLQLLPGAGYEWGLLDKSGAAETPTNCFYYGALLRSAELATLLGYPLDAAEFTERAALVRDGINATLFDGVDRYRDSTGSQKFSAVSSALALAFDVVPAEKDREVYEYLQTFKFGPVSTPAWFYYFSTLIERGAGKRVHQLLDQTENLWGGIIAQGATTAWEFFVPDYSLSHGWTAFPMWMFARGIVGIHPTSAGFRTFDVQPQLGDLSYANADVWTPNGMISARWTQAKTRRTLQLEVPENTVATLYLPKLDYRIIRAVESSRILFSAGTYLGGVTGVSFVENRPGFLVLQVVAGSYSFMLDGMQITSTNPLPQPTGKKKP